MSDLDRAAATRTPTNATSTGRFDGDPTGRFDGDPRRARISRAIEQVCRDLAVDYPSNRSSLRRFHAVSLNPWSLGTPITDLVDEDFSAPNPDSR